MNLAVGLLLRPNFCPPGVRARGTRDLPSAIVAVINRGVKPSGNRSLSAVRSPPSWPVLNIPRSSIIISSVCSIEGKKSLFGFEDNVNSHSWPIGDVQVTGTDRYSENADSGPMPPATGAGKIDGPEGAGAWALRRCSCRASSVNGRQPEILTRGQYSTHGG